MAVNMAPILIHFPPTTIDRLDNIASTRRLSRSAVVRMAVDKLCAEEELICNPPSDTVDETAVRP